MCNVLCYQYLCSNVFQAANSFPYFNTILLLHNIMCVGWWIVAYIVYGAFGEFFFLLLLLLCVLFIFNLIWCFCEMSVLVCICCICFNVVGVRLLSFRIVELHISLSKMSNTRLMFFFLSVFVSMLYNPHFFGIDFVFIS